MPELQEYYDILKVPRTATLPEIKRAFRRLARQYHPDLNPDNPDAEAIFKTVCEAYEILQERVYQNSGGSDWQPDGETHPLDAYVAGVQHMLDKNYLAAVNCFSEAIALQPSFVPAYLKRCQVNLYLGSHRAVLQDCQHILTLQPQSADAQYYRGRARYRLGYIQSAIDAYSQAIALQPSHASAYYHRGIAYLDLKHQAQAIHDLQTAADCFQSDNDTSGYRLAQTTLERIRRGGIGGGIVVHLLKTAASAVGAAVRAVPWILVNPEKQLPATVQHLQQYHLAGAAGLLLAIASISVFTVGIAIGWQPVIPLASPQIAFAGGLVFSSLVLMSAIARWAFDRRSSTLGGDCLVVGVALVPVGLLPLVGALLLGTGTFSLGAIALVALWYTGLLLYLGFVQVQDIPSGYAAMLVPLSLLLSSAVVRLVWLVSGA